MLESEVSNDSIRVACGVSAAEWPDEAFTAADFATEFENEYHFEFNTSLDYKTVADIISEGNDADPMEDAYFLLYYMKEWYKYYAAARIAYSAHLSLAKKITDSENSIERFPMDYEALRNAMARLASVAKNRFYFYLTGDELFAQGASSSILGTSSPSYDPVTGQ